MSATLLKCGNTFERCLQEQCLSVCCSAYQHVGDSSGNLTLSANVTAVQTCVVNKVIFKCYSAWPRKIEIMTFTKKSEARLDIRPTSLEVIGFMVKSVSLKNG